MRLLSALLDVALLPVSVAQDLVVRPLNYACAIPNDEKSATRQKIESIEDNLRRKA